MIRVQDLCSKIYSAQSRDFQFIGRLFDVVLNSAKTNIDQIYYLPFSDNSDEKLVQLMALTLGFRSKHTYSERQLRSACSVFSRILKSKGTLQSINLAVNALLNAEGISDQALISINKDDHYQLDISIPESLSDINLLKDLLEYIIPAGMSCNITREIVETSKASTEVGTQVHVGYKIVSNDREAVVREFTQTEEQPSGNNFSEVLIGDKKGSITFGEVYHKFTNQDDDEGDQ